MVQLAQLQNQRKSAFPQVKAPGAGTFAPMASADLFGALDKYFKPQLQGLGWKGSAFDNSALMAGGGGDSNAGPELGMSQAFSDFLAQNGLSGSLSQGDGQNTIRLLQGDTVLGEQTYKTENALDKFASKAVPLAIALGSGGVFGQALGLINPGLNPLDPSTWGSSAGTSSGGAASATAEGGIGTLPGQAIPPITPPSGPLSLPSGGSMASGVDKIFEALKTGGGKLLDQITGDPLKALGVAGALGTLAASRPSGAPSFDAAGAAQLQGDANKDASWFDAILNRPDMNTPWGSSTWTLKEGADPKNPKPGDWVNNVALDPAQQQLLDSDNQLKLGYTNLAQSLLGGVGDSLGKPFDLSALPDMPDFGSINTEADRSRIEAALLERLNPQLARDEESLRTRLLNTGFEFGSEGSNIQLDAFNRQKNDARLAAIIQAGTEARGLADSQRANMLAQLQGRQQGFNEQAAVRQMPLNELNALRAGSQVTPPQFQSVVPTNTAAAPELDALLAKLGLSQSNATNSQAGFNAVLQALAGLGSAWIGGKP